MTVADRIEVVLDLNDRGFSVKLKGAAADLDRLGLGLNNLDRRIKKSERALHGFTASLRDWTLIIGQARNALHQLWIVFGAVPAQIVKVNSEIERMEFLLRGMSDAATQAGKDLEAAMNLEALFDFAKNAPFSINALTDSFVKFKSVGLEPLDGSMQSLVDATAAFGGTDETLKRASIAIQQMAGKGVISMEELRQQLGEAVPQAITIMAQSMGLSYGQLVKEISEGKVAAEPALKAMFTGFEVAFGGRAQGLMESFSGQMAVMRTSMTELISESDGMSDFYDQVKLGAQAINELLVTREVEEVMNGLGRSLAIVTQGFVYVIDNASIAYSTIKALKDVVIETAFTKEDTLLYQIRVLAEEAQTAVDNLFEATDNLNARWGESLGAEQAENGLFQILPALDKKINSWISGRDVDVSMFEGKFWTDLFFGEGADVADEILQQQLQSGNAIVEGGLDDALRVYDNHLARMDAIRAEMQAAQQELSGTAATFAPEMLENGEEIFLLEQRDVLLADLENQREYVEERRQRAQDKIDILNQEIEALRALQVKEAGDISIAGLERKAQREQEITDLALHRDRVMQAMNRDLDERRRIIAEINKVSQLQGDGTFVPGIGFQSAGQESRLQELAESAVPAVREAAELVQELQRRLEEAAREASDMADTINSEMTEASEDMASEYVDRIQDFQAEANSAGAQMLADIQAAMTAPGVAEEDRLARATEVANTFFDTQVAGYVAIGEVAQAELAEQGNMGLEAAGLVAAQIVEILDAIEQRRAAVIGNLTLDRSVGGTKPSSRGGGGKSDAEKAADKIKKLREDLEDDMVAVQRRLADPFGFEIPKAIEKTEEKLRDIVELLKPGASLVEGMTAEMQELLQTARQIALGETVLDIKETMRDVERSMMGDRGQRNAEAQDQIDYLNDLKEYYTEYGLWRVEHETLLQERIRQIQQEARSQSPLGEWLDEWKNFGDSMEEIVVDGLDGISQALADLATEGEMNLNRLGRALVNNLIKTGLMNGMSAIGNWMQGDGGGGGFWSALGNFLSGGTEADVAHTGSVIGTMEGSRRTVSPLTFAGAPRFHTGGIVGDEVPAILKKKEGVFTPAQMQALGGLARQAPNVGINVINNSGMQMDMEQGETRFDGDKMVLDVVLKAANQPGTFRDSLKGALK